MTVDAIRAAVEHYSPNVFGRCYSLRLVRLESRSSSDNPIVAARLEIAAFSQPSDAQIPLHILVCVGDASELLHAVDAALHQQVFELAMSAVTPRPWRMRAAHTVRGAQRRNPWSRVWARRPRFAH